MSIEITEFADVSISVSPTGVSGGNFGILGFLAKSSDSLIGSAISPAERARPYTSLATVGGDWGTSSEVYKAATAFYAQTPTPRDFTVIMNYDVAQAASLVGGSSLTEANLIAAAWNGTGALEFTVDGTTISITDLDVSAATTYADIASEIETAIQLEVGGATVTCTHDGSRFVIKSGTTGAASTITVASDSDAANNLGLTAAFAQVSDGLDAETAVDSLAASVTKGIEFVGLVTDKSYRDYTTGLLDSGNSAEDIAVWAEGAKKIFCNTTNALSTLTATTGHVAAAVKSRTLRFTLTTFSRDTSAYPSASVFGRAASVNFESINSTITLNLKQMPTVAAENLSPAEFAKLRENYASAVVQVGKTVNAYTDSRMASGSWLDTTHGILWLENRIETDVFNLLYVNNTKIPYTQAGLNTLVATVERSLRAAVRNGLAGAGFLPNGNYLPEGFIVESVPLADVSVGDKGNRIYQGLSFKVVGAGALHEVVISGEFSE